MDKPVQTKWSDYYRATAGREPRDLFTRALRLFESVDCSGRMAVDLGFGDGTETLALLASGWNVLAIDREEAAVALLNSRVPPALKGQLEIREAAFETVGLPHADLVYAGLSLFFCTPLAFQGVWSCIKSSIQPGGRFAGHFIGKRDSWSMSPALTSHTADEVRQLIDGLAVEYFEELEHDHPAVSGPKHWHLFQVIARRP